MVPSSSKESDKLKPSKKQKEANIKMYISTWGQIFNDRCDTEYANKKYCDKDITYKNQKETVRSTSLKGFQIILMDTLLRFLL
jgi:hypothetical protein